MPGIACRMMSSRLGLVAEVIATESPSQLRPVVIQRTWAVTASVFLCSAYDLASPSPLLSPQQIRGSGSPTSWSITRRPPKLVSTSTIPGGSVRTSPISAACSQPGTAAQRRERRVGRLGGDERDQLALVGDVHRVDPEDLGRPRHRRRHRHRAPRARASPPPTRGPARSAPMRRRRGWRRAGSAGCGPAASSSASTAGHSERVSDSISASSSNSPRASMIAVPCSPIVPESRMRSPGRTAAGESCARGSRRPMPVVQTYMPSAWPRSTTLVSPATTSTPAARAAPAIASTSARSSSAAGPPRGPARAQRERPRAGDGEVVDRAVDRELADRAAREAQRLDDVGVGGERQRDAVDARARRRRPARPERLAAEGRHEQPFDQRLGGLAARAVGHRDLRVAELRPLGCARSR